MEEIAKTPRSAAAIAATEHLVATAHDPTLFPDRTAFVASDAPELAAIIARCVGEQRPIAIVFPNGDTQLATPTQGALVGLLLIAVHLLASYRRKRRASDSNVVALPPRYRVEYRHERIAA
jgi:hypothetical protein